MTICRDKVKEDVFPFWCTHFIWTLFCSETLHIFHIFIFGQCVNNLSWTFLGVFRFTPQGGDKVWEALLLVLIFTVCPQVMGIEGTRLMGRFKNISFTEKFCLCLIQTHIVRYVKWSGAVHSSVWPRQSLWVSVVCVTKVIFSFWLEGTSLDVPAQN